MSTAQRRDNLRTDRRIVLRVWTAVSAVFQERFLEIFKPPGRGLTSAKKMASSPLMTTQVRGGMDASVKAFA